MIQSKYAASTDTTIGVDIMIDNAVVQLGYASMEPSPVDANAASATYDHCWIKGLDEQNLSETIDSALIKSHLGSAVFTVDAALKRR